jgi:hypothetical protein
MSARTPAVSVVMPAHNARPYVEESVASILGQTFEDFELVILENGSSDGTAELLERLALTDPRIRVVPGAQHIGHARASAAAVAESRAPIVARMDADDVSHPRRLERQLHALERHPGAVLVGALDEGIDSSGRRVRPFDRSLLLHSAIEAPFSHGCALFRRDAYDAIGGYRDVEGWTDLDLFQRLGQQGRVVVIPEPLYRLRFHGSSTTVRRPPEIARQVAAEKEAVARERFPGALNGPRPDSHRALDVAYEESAMRLWRGQRPAFLSALASQGLVGVTMRRPQLLAWGALGAVSPATLRSAIRLAKRARDRVAGRRLAGQGEVEWRFG